MKKNIIQTMIFLLLLGISQEPIKAQDQTVGLLSFDHDESYEGYNLFYPHNQSTVYLIDNCGEIVHTWEDEPDFRPGNTVSLLKNGNILKTKRDANISDDVIWAGGAGEFVELRSWDNELLWSFGINTDTERLHHEALAMDNGNVMMIVYEAKTAEEAIAAGRDTALLADGVLWSDYILEVKPIGTDSFEVVWEWHAWDHLIQDYDETKANYGVIADHPERIDINALTSAGAGKDWLHSNAIDFNSFLDQVMISVPHISEIWIIDHATTIEQSAGTTGGNSGMGGDLVYRWGNPAAYAKGDSTNQQLFFQHDAHWIDLHLNSGHVDFGKIMVFNNRVEGTYSSVNVIAPTFDGYESGYAKSADETYLPEVFDWEYIAEEPESFFSSGLSSAQRLENGNTLIGLGRPGEFIELNEEKETIWKYKVPLIQGQAATQGDSLVLSTNLTFNVKRYPFEFEAFEGKDLSPKGFIELEPLVDFCQLPLGLENIVDKPVDMLISPNPSTDFVDISTKTPLTETIDLNVFNALGQLVYAQKMETNSMRINTSNWQEGLYFLQLNGSNYKKILVQR